MPRRPSLPDAIPTAGPNTPPQSPRLDRRSKHHLAMILKRRPETPLAFVTDNPDHAAFLEEAIRRLDLFDAVRLRNVLVLTEVALHAIFVWLQRATRNA